jgi:diacylglycerol kinase family enzyme
LGSARGKLFAIMVSAGFDADVVHRLHQKRKGHVSKRSYAWHIIQSASAYAFPTIEVEIPDSGERLYGSLVFVFNLPRYGLGLPIVQAADPADGWLDLCVFERPGGFHLLRYAAAIVTRRDKHLKEVQRRRVKCVRLSSDRPVPVQTDGDPAGFLPVTVEICCGAARIVTASQSDL